MAIAAKLRMKVRDIMPAGGGAPERVELEEVFGDATNNTLHVNPTSGSPGKTIHPFELSIDKPASQGLFLEKRHYLVEFTLLDPEDGIR